jgi:hypothetical protein
MKIKRRTLHLFKIWAIRIASIVVLCGGYYTYAYTTIFTITSYDIQGVDDASRTRIDTKLHEIAKKKSFLIVPRDKIFTYNNSAIITAVRDEVSDVATISMRPVGLHTVKVSITLLIPVLKTEDGQAITEDGIIFTPAKSVWSYPSITIASSTKGGVKRSGLPFTQLYFGGEKVDAAFLDTLLSMSTKVSSLIFPVTSILVEETGDVTLSNASGTSKVMFLQDAEPKKVWSTIVSAIDTEPLKSKLDTEKDKLLYLDARYGNKVFYRFSDMTFQNGKGAVIMDNHASTTQATSTRTH